MSERKITIEFWIPDEKIKEFLNKDDAITVSTVATQIATKTKITYSQPIKQCLFCGRDFEYEKEAKKFCSDKCRVYYFRRHNKNQ